MANCSAHEAAACSRIRRTRIALRASRATGVACIFALFHLSPAPTAEADCRELDRNYTVAKTDINAIQLNAMLFTSAARNCSELARRLIADGASLQARDRLGAMPLARAARGGHTALVERFLAEGAAIDARDLAGGTALYAAAANEHPDTVALLLARGANPNLTGRSDVSPLAAAAFRGNDRIVELLLARGAEADHVDATGKTPIAYASARGFALIVRRLLDAGVDAKARYGNELTALMWAAGHDDGVDASAAVEAAELLIGHGAVIDGADNRGRTALMFAAERGDGAVATVLVAHGADRGLRDKAGKTACDLGANDAVREALHCAGATGRPDTPRAP
jgi:uncharacterized protein